MAVYSSRYLARRAVSIAPSSSSSSSPSSGSGAAEAKLAMLPRRIEARRLPLGDLGVLGDFALSISAKKAPAPRVPFGVEGILGVPFGVEGFLGVPFGVDEFLGVPFVAVLGDMRSASSSIRASFASSSSSSWFKRDLATSSLVSSERIRSYLGSPAA